MKAGKGNHSTCLVRTPCKKESVLAGEGQWEKSAHPAGFYTGAQGGGLIVFVPFWVEERLSRGLIYTQS